MNNELRTTNYQLNTNDEQQATCDEFAPFWSFFADFCAFCASLRLTRTVFTRLLNKAVSMALWTKAILRVKSSLLEQSLPGTPSQPKTSMISVNPVILSNLSSCPNVFVAKNLFNQRNLRLIKDLRAYKSLYRCRETFTNVMSALQIHLFMQNKANFQKSQMDVNKVLTKDYEQMDTWSIGKTKPIIANSKPIKANSKPIKANKMPKQTQYKPNLSRRSLWRSRKQTQFTLLNLANSVSPLTYAAPFRIIIYELTGLIKIVADKYGEYS